MKLVIALVLLVLGSLVFHWLSPWWFTPLASNWNTVDTTVDITLYITGFVFVVVNLFMAYAVFRYRHSPSRRAHYEPENKKLETWLVGLTAVGVVAMLAPGLVVWADFTRVPKEAHEVEVLGEQWQWNYRFPGEDGKFGKVDAIFLGPDNPFGIDPKDTAGADDILVRSNELHLPADKPVKMLMRSKDVLHNFAVPQFRVKMDMVPGTVSYAWFTPTKNGTFDVLCMELCGIAHYAMRGRVVVEHANDFDAWLANYPTWQEYQGQAQGDPKAGKTQYQTCVSCHGQDGEGNKAMNAPALAGMEPWYVERQLQYFKDGIRGIHKKDPYGKQMAGMAQVLANDKAVRDVAAYIASLEPVDAPATVEGNAKKGAAKFNVCGSCHGEQGQGNVALQAPRLAGLQDWYVKRQLRNFREGYRGVHPEDNYGKQMALMARTLNSEESIENLLAYLNTL